MRQFEDVEKHQIHIYVSEVQHPMIHNIAVHDIEHFRSISENRTSIPSYAYVCPKYLEARQGKTSQSCLVANDAMLLEDRDTCFGRGKTERLQRDTP
jgi:hypothetical protein